MIAEHMKGSGNNGQIYRFGAGSARIKRLIAFRDSAPNGVVSGMPCGACREFLYQLNEENENMEIMVDYEKRETVTLKELLPAWWGKKRSDLKK